MLAQFPVATMGAAVTGGHRFHAHARPCTPWHAPAYTAIFQRLNPTVVIARDGGRPSNHGISILGVMTSAGGTGVTGSPAFAGDDTVDEMEP